MPSAKKFLQRSMRLGVEAQLLERRARQLGELDREQAVAVERVVLERVDLELRLLEVGRLEVVRVDDEDAVRPQVGEVRLQRGRVHRDEDVGRVAGRVDVARREVELEARDARQRARGRADLGREVRERREVVADKRGRVGELAAGDLHAVAGVAAEADDRLLQDFLVPANGCFGRRHKTYGSSVPDPLGTRCVPAKLKDSTGGRGGTNRGRWPARKSLTERRPLE